MTKAITIFSDYKSPYAYLAVAEADRLARDHGADILWRPYILDIPAYLGAARVDDSGKVLAEERNAHQWRRVRYSYMDVRRYANRAGLTIRGPRKIFDSTVAGVGMLYAQAHGGFRPYHDLVFERFFKRELDIEDPAAIAAVLAEAGADPADWDSYVTADGPAEVKRIQAEAEEQGVFGVPSFVLDGEIFWGREHLPLIEEMLVG
jgi:2-hydroxychromene-2-carboxylate isomerase